MGIIFSDAGWAFKEALRLRPQDFSPRKNSERHIIFDVKTGFQWWIANGGFFFTFTNIHGDATQPKGAEFNLIERHFLWWDYVRWRDRNKIRASKKGNREAAVKLAMVLQPQETADESSKTGRSP